MSNGTFRTGPPLIVRTGSSMPRACKRGKFPIGWVKRGLDDDLDFISPWPCKHGVTGSLPVTSTMILLSLLKCRPVRITKFARNPCLAFQALFSRGAAIVMVRRARF